METAGPNEIWPADFKGQFKTGDGKYCYPLTVTDHYSRMLLLCKALRSVQTEGTKSAFRALFRKHGLPDAIRTDNGAPFASTGIHGLCELNVFVHSLVLAVFLGTRRADSLMNDAELHPPDIEFAQPVDSR